MYSGYEKPCACQVCDIIMCLLHLEPTLTLPNLCQALAEVEDWHGLGQLLCVPDSKLDEIKAKHLDSIETKRQMFHHFLTSYPAPSWRVVFEGLYQMGNVKCHYILQDVRRRYGRGIVYVCIDTNKSYTCTVCAK